MFFNKSIRSRVMAVLNEKINTAQALHDSKMEELKAEQEAERETLEQRQEAARGDLTDSTVNSLTSLFLK